MTSVFNFLHQIDFPIGRKIFSLFCQPKLVPVTTAVLEWNWYRRNSAQSESCSKCCLLLKQDDVKIRDKRKTCPSLCPISSELVCSQWSLHIPSQWDRSFFFLCDRNNRGNLPLFHFLAQVYSLFLQQLNLGKGPIHRLSTWKDKKVSQPNVKVRSHWPFHNRCFWEFFIGFCFGFLSWKENGWLTDLTFHQNPLPRRGSKRTD